MFFLERSGYNRPVMREKILALSCRLRRRLRWIRGLDLFLELSFIISIPISMLLLLDRILFESGWTGIHLAPWASALMASGIGFAILLAAAITLSQKISPGVIGRLADQSVGGEERFLSALELVHAEGGNAFQALVLKDAARLPIQPKRTIRPPRIRHRWGTVIALGTVLVLELFPPEEIPRPHAEFSLSEDGGPAPLTVEFHSRHQGSVRTIEWDFGDGTQGSGVRVSHLYPIPGSYVVRQTVTGPGGTSSAEKAVRVVAVHDPWASFTALPGKGRVPLRVVFKNRSRNGKSYSWDFGDGTTSTEKNPGHTFTKPGTFPVKLAAMNGPKSHDVEISIQVLAPDAPRSDFRAHPRSGEAPLRVAFDNLSSGEIDSQEWDFGDRYAANKNHSREKNPVHLFRFPGTYTIRLRSLGPHGEDLEEKEAYIQVGAGGDNPNTGGGGKKPTAKNQGPNKSSGGGNEEGRLFGKKTRPKKIRIDPMLVTSPGIDSEKTLREQWVWSGETPSPGNPSAQKLEHLFPVYERTLEKTMGRERVPSPVRNYVKNYFEQIRPK